jgi:hypothetical protein
VSSFVREHPRVPIELAVRLRVSTWGEYLDLYATNLSQGGLFVPGALSAPPGTAVQVEILLPDGGVCALTAEVAHTGDGTGLGLDLRGIDGARRAQLAGLVERARRMQALAHPDLPKAVRPEDAPGPPPTAAPPARPPPIPPDSATQAARQPKFADVVQHALTQELARRQDLPPAEQLGVAALADAATVEAAWKTLRERYDPAIFRRYGAATVNVVERINRLLVAAHRMLTDPGAKAPPAGPQAPAPQAARSDDARRILKSAIDRRMSEATALRAQGQKDEAVRAYHEVLQLDRKHEGAQEALRALRPPTPEGPSPPSGLLSRLRRR